MNLTRKLLCVLLFDFLASTLVQAQRFYPDDPLMEEPPPMETPGPETRALSELLEYFQNTFGLLGETHPEFGVIPAVGVNTLGEVLDGPWYTNRHARRRMSRAELIRGPGDADPPSTQGPWQVLTVKKYGVRPGMLVADANKHLYLLQFDPPNYLELNTGAEMVGSRIFHALGYWVPEDYIVYFLRDQLAVAASGEDVTSLGAARDLRASDIDWFLKDVARDPKRGYRAVATRIPASQLVGPFQMFGARSDDPNDIYAHEHRRELRGLAVFCAWLNHNFFRSAANTMDLLLEENGVQFIRHYLIDFRWSMGSGEGGPKSTREGNEPAWEMSRSLKNLAGMGVYTPGWMRAHYPRLPAIGNFEAKTFYPGKWMPNQKLAPFLNRLPDDAFWAAKQVMAFTDEDIRVLVSTAQYTDPAASEWLTNCLIKRRDKIGRFYLATVLPLNDFRIEQDRLTFEDLEIRYGFSSSRKYSVAWSEFDNEAEQHNTIESTAGLDLPSEIRNAEEGSYFASQIWGQDPEMFVTVYLRRESDGLKVVGIDQGWPGKILADRHREEYADVARYQDLMPEQKRLFADFTQDFNASTGRDLDDEEYFDSRSISERTTFDAVTHALHNSKLSDEGGQSLGTALGLIAKIDRVAGQYYGRSGDQQFRVYSEVRSETRDILEKSKEFYRDHDNTVYHKGYPLNYRQKGKPPTIQISLMEEGTRADIDVDYRSSKMPQSLFNGHLTSSNSDVRAGDNAGRHSKRWLGFIAWWQNVFGEKKFAHNKGSADLLQHDPPELETAVGVNRVPGAHIADLHEAAREFLTDWLVRREYDQAMTFLSDHALACINIDEDNEDEALNTQRTREELRELMEVAIEELGDRDNLTEAIDTVRAGLPSETRVIQHPYEGDFLLVELTTERGEHYLCDQQIAELKPYEPTSADPKGYGVYYAVVFRFKIEQELSGTLSLLWMKKAGEWRIISYEALGD